MGNDVGGPIGATAAGAQPWTYSPRTVFVGDTDIRASTDGTDTTPVVTETYIGELPVPGSLRTTGFALLNGSAVAGNVVVILYNAAGAVITTSALAGTAQAGVAALQRIPWIKPINLPPGIYYVGVQFNNVAARFRANLFGNFGQAKKTGEVFGTPTSIAALPPPTTFAANVGPIGGLY